MSFLCAPKTIQKVLRRNYQLSKMLFRKEILKKYVEKVAIPYAVTKINSVFFKYKTSDGY